jgi:glutathione S-transferase
MRTSYTHVCICKLQNLNKFVEQHGSSEGGDFFLGGSYSFAEVAGTPFVHRASAALPALRGYSIDTAIQQQKLTRLDAWIKVTCLPLVCCIEYL